MICLIPSRSPTFHSCRIPNPEERIGLRLIAVRTEAEAASLLNQIQSGQSFEAIANKAIDPRV